MKSQMFESHTLMIDFQIQTFVIEMLTLVTHTFKIEIFIELMFFVIDIQTHTQQLFMYMKQKWIQFQKQQYPDLFGCRI